MRWATEQSAKLQAGEDMLLDPTPVLSRLLGFYLGNQTPRKSRAEQKADHRRAKLFVRFFGPKKDVRRITRREWDRFIELRHSGAIDCRGFPISPDERKSVSLGTVGGDLVFLRTLLHWALRWQDDYGRYLLRENSCRGFQIPSEKNPRRPVVTTDRYEAVLATAQSMRMRVHWDLKPKYVRSHLPDLLVFAWHTGRRISAILALRFEDLQLGQGPFGSIRWPRDTDKMGKESLVPIAKEVREVLDRILAERPGIRGAPIFPAPHKVSKPVSIDVASAWLLKAESIARVPKQDGSLWHAFRRGWATARKHQPAIDVASAGGWANTGTLEECYQHADPQTMFEIVSQPNEIRSIR